MKKYIVALDQGTTSSRCIIFDHAGDIVSQSAREITQYYPKPGWVEQSPIEIYATQVGVLFEALGKKDIHPTEIAAIGITNQRETTIAWDKHTGEPVCNAIVWQCRRTAPICEQLQTDTSFTEYITANTGLRLDAYFSATKLSWILENIPGAREKAEEGTLLFGTVDTWLLWKLSGGKCHVTDYTNASRTMLYDIQHLCWDQTILNRLDIPLCMLPKVCSSSEILCTTSIDGVEVPISGLAGDQQAALFGQMCFQPGEIKNTYGTGNFILMNTGKNLVRSKNGLLTTIACAVGGEITYALEGSVFMGGAVIQWMRDEMRFFREAAEVDKLAESVSDTGGVYFVPAFTGLGAPHWDMQARGSIFGMTRGTTREHLIRAALESIAYQSRDVMVAMSADTGVSLQELKVDGGASASNVLMQFQADITGTTLCCPAVRETTALGAAFLAGLAVGFWCNQEELIGQRKFSKRYEPKMEESRRKEILEGWECAVKSAKQFHFLQK